MSILSIGLLIAFIVLFIWIKREDKHKWETVYESYGDSMGEAQRRLHYLRSRGIHCRLKNDSPGTSMMGMGSTQNAAETSVQLQVQKKETDQAFKYLADFNE